MKPNIAERTIILNDDEDDDDDDTGLLQRHNARANRKEAIFKSIVDYCVFNDCSGTAFKDREREARNDKVEELSSFVLILKAFAVIVHLRWLQFITM